MNYVFCGFCGLKRGISEELNCVRFVFKMGLDIQLDIQLGVLLWYGSQPHKDKKGLKFGDFEPINTPLIPKLGY